MNELEIKSSWLKIQINSFYGLNTQDANKLTIEYRQIKNKIRLIKKRKDKIINIYKYE
jgi:hypothetical protein